MPKMTIFGYFWVIFGQKLAEDENLQLFLPAFVAENAAFSSWPALQEHSANCSSLTVILAECSCKPGLLKSAAFLREYGVVFG